MTKPRSITPMPIEFSLARCTTNDRGQHVGHERVITVERFDDGTIHLRTKGGRIDLAFTAPTAHDLAGIVSNLAYDTIVESEMEIHSRYDSHMETHDA